MGDIDYGALFGIDMTGEKETEAAEPSADTGAQGAEEQEAAESSENGPGAGEPAEGVGETAPEGEASGTPEEQSPEERARYAAARRKAEAERDAAVEKARQDAAAEAQRTIDETFRSMGLTDPFTGKPITSKVEFDAYRQRYQAQQKAGFLQKSGMTDEEFDQFVSELPEVRQARQAQLTAQAAAKAAREQQAKLRVDGQLKEIGALDPSVRSLEDLARMETYPKFYELVKKGNTLTDAFKLANYDALTRSTAAASRQAAINAAQSKQHLEPTTQRGAGAVSVPADVKEAYRAFNPNATDADIQAHYARYMKK